MQTKSKNNLKNKIESIKNNMKNMITKIINHKHTKTLAAILVVAGLIGYASNYKKSEAFAHSSYMYDVDIKSSNIDNSNVATLGDYIYLSFEVFDSSTLENLTASINGRPVQVTCESGTNPNLVISLIETAHAQYYSPSICTTSIQISEEDVNNSSYLSQAIPFEINFSQSVIDGDNVYISDFLVNNTDNGSYVNIKREVKASDYIYGVHIESTTPTDTTLAAADNKVLLRYYISEYSEVFDKRVTILDKEANLLCESVKDNPVTAPTSATIINSKLVIIREQTGVNIEVKTETTPITFIESLITKSYAKVGEPLRSDTKDFFYGPALCFASIDVLSEDLENKDYSIVPFVISMRATLGENNIIKIENTTDKSFVRIEKSMPVSVSAPVQSAGILAIGLTSSVPTTIIPQDTLIRDDNKNNLNTVVKKEEQNNIAVKCPFVKGFYKIGDYNVEIKKIRQGINSSMGTNLPINNKFDKELFVALKAWQEKYRDTVLDPWGTSESSGYFYKTSNWSMNYQVGCEVPKFVLEKYKNN